MGLDSDQHGLFAEFEDDGTAFASVTRGDPIQSILVHFESREDVLAFAALVGQPVSTETKRLHFPSILELDE
jgi:hypothetical protein